VVDPSRDCKLSVGLPLKWGMEPGDYTCTLTVEDRLGERQAK
jgi:hypothetical protein